MLVFQTVCLPFQGPGIYYQPCLPLVTEIVNNCILTNLSFFTTFWVNYCIGDSANRNKEVAVV